MRRVRVGSLCTGYGGIEMGLVSAGVEVDLRWYAEIEPIIDFDAPNLGDITTVDFGAVEHVDLLTAGFPCQSVSAAGRQLGERDPRWLWPWVRDAVVKVEPRMVLIENVRNLVSTQKGALWAGILDDLTGLGYGVRWCTLGACHVGAAHHRHRVFALATMGGAGVERVETTFCGAKDGKALPTPTAREGDRHGRGEGDEYYWRRRAEAGRTNGMPLGAAVRLFPTPSVSNSHGNDRNNRDELLLPGIVRDLALLPTPRATDGVNGGPGQRGRRGDLAMPSAVQTQNWRRYADAVARHEAIYGPAPAPTEPNRNGAPRLAPAFAEWLMCLPAGHVAARLDRIPALRAIGNGVCPPQLAAAWALLGGSQ